MSQAIISTDMVYALKVKSSGYYLDGRDAHYKNPLMSYTSDPQSYGSPLHWKFEQVGDGFWAMKCLGNNWYLDGRNGNKKDPVMTSTSNPSSYGNVLHWKIESNGSSDSNGICWVSLQCQGNKFYLDGRDGHKDAIMADRSPSGDAYLTWYLVPLNCTLHANITDFDFGDSATVMAELEAQKNLEYIDTNTVNAEVAGVTVSGSFTDKVENSYSFGFSESIGAGCGASVTAGIPTLMETTFSINFDFNFTSNQQWTETETKEIKESYSFTPEKPGLYEVGMMIYTANDVKLPFTAKVLFNATNFNSDNSGMPCSGNEILSLIGYYGNTCEIVNVGSTSVECVISGILTGGWYAEKYVWTSEITDTRGKVKFGNNKTVTIKSKL